MSGIKKIPEGGIYHDNDYHKTVAFDALGIAS